MGEVLKILGAVRDVKQNLNAVGIGGGGRNGSQAPQLPGITEGDAPTGPDFGMQGMTQGGGVDVSQGASQAYAAPPTLGAPEAQQAAPPPEEETPEAANSYGGDEINPYEDQEEVAKSIQSLPDVVVEGDDFKPKKVSTLGRLMDTLLQIRGRKPIFSDRTDAANLKAAMDGVNEQDTPGRLVARVKRFNPEMALAIEEKQQVLKMRQAAAQRLEDNAKVQRVGKVANVVRGMMKSVKDQPTLDKVMQYADRYAKAQNVDLEELGAPREYDPDAITSWREGGMSVDQGYDNDRADARNETLEDHSEQRIGQSAAREARMASLGGARLTETKRHNQAMENRPSGRGGGGGSKAEGKAGEVVYSPDGNIAKRYNPKEKKWVYFRKGEDGKHRFDPALNN